VINVSRLSLLELMMIPCWKQVFPHAHSGRSHDVASVRVRFITTRQGASCMSSIPTSWREPMINCLKVIGVFTVNGKQGVAIPDSTALGYV